VTDLIRIWIVPVDVPPAVAARCRSVLDESDRARAAAFLSERDRQRFTIAHGALRILAGRELAVPPSALRWTAGRYGKPDLAPPCSGLHTSLSHSGDMIAAAISTGRPVGLDIQQLLPGLDPVGLAARFFPPDESAYVAAGRDASTRADRFARLWIRKEAVVKAAGGRLWPNLRIPVRGREVAGCAEPAGVYRVAEVATAAGYRAAVALAGPVPFAIETASWPARDPITGSSPPPRSPPAAGRGSAAARGPAPGRTAARHRLGG
jgi:4'-phosphopantetheinyl transferase